MSEDLDRFLTKLARGAKGMTKTDISAEASRLGVPAGRDDVGRILPDYDRRTACTIIHALRFWQTQSAAARGLRWNEDDVEMMSDDEIDDLVEEINFGG